MLGNLQFIYVAYMSRLAPNCILYQTRLITNLKLHLANMKYLFDTRTKHLVQLVHIVQFKKNK